MGPSILVAINATLFTSWQEKVEKAGRLEAFFLRGQPPSSSPVWNIYIGIFSPTPTFITVYVRYRHAFVARKNVHARKNSHADNRTDFSRFPADSKDPIGIMVLARIK